MTEQADETTSQIHNDQIEAHHEAVSSEQEGPSDPASAQESDVSNGEIKVEDTPEVPSRASPALLQALLLASGEPVSYVRLQEIMRCSRAEVLSNQEALNQRCADEESGIEVVTVGERLQLRTKAAFADAIRELLAVKPRKLSQAALETLSVVAYQQPIVKSEIDKIRGVDVTPTLKTLLERKIIKILGYQASVGQPALYGTTEEFLRIFGLGSLSELPALKDLRVLAKEPGEAGEGIEVESQGDDEQEPLIPQESTPEEVSVVNA